MSVATQQQYQFSLHHLTMFESQFNQRSPSPASHRRTNSMRSYSDFDLAATAGAGASMSAKDAELNSLRRELSFRATSSPNLVGYLDNLPTSPTMVMRQDKQIHEIKTEYEQAIMMRDMQIQNLRREVDHHLTMCQGFEQQVKDLKFELAERNAQVAQDIITASKKSVEMNEVIKVKDSQICALQRDINERINLSQQEKVMNQKALEAARAVFAADLETALAAKAEEKRRMEEEIRDYKERLGIFDEAPAVVDSRVAVALRLTSSEIRLGNEIKELKNHYGILDENALDIDRLLGDCDMDGLLDSLSDDEKDGLKKKHSSNNLRRPSSKNLLRRHSSDTESSLSSVSSDSDLGPNDESKVGSPSRKKKNSSPRRSRQHRAPSDQEDLTDNSTTSAPKPKEKPESNSPNKAAEAEAKAAAEKKTSNVKTPAEMCKLFGITNTSVFDGDMIKKKFSTDFLAKESFVWVNPACRSIHWAKSAMDKVDPKHSKFLLLKKSTVKEDQQHKLGEKKGTVKGVMKLPHNGGIMVSTEEGEFLEIKVPPENMANWAQVLRVLV